MHASQQNCWCLRRGASSVVSFRGRGALSKANHRRSVKHFGSKAAVSHQHGVHARSGTQEEAPGQVHADGPSDNAPIDWFDNWYPVAFAIDVNPEVPYRFVLLGIPIVIWWDPNASVWRAFRDACPHRLVPLSEGRINRAGLLECAYHGWAFAGADGACAALPQGGNSGSPRACATSYPCALRQGLVFVKPRALPNAALLARAGAAGNGGGSGEGGRLAAAAAALCDPSDIPLVEELEDGSWVSQDTWRDVPYDWSTLMENVLDSSHVPFTHHKSISNRNILGPYDMRLTSPVTASGFKGEWVTGPRAGRLGPQFCTFRAPAFMVHLLDGAALGRGLQSLVVVYSVPVAPGRCRLINRNCVRFVGGGAAAAVATALLRTVPGWLIHVGTQVPLEDDQIFLHLGEEEYVAQRAAGRSDAQAYYMPSPADAYVLGFRRWLERHGGGGPWGQLARAALPPRLERRQLLDRFAQHTERCAQCARALAGVRHARRAAAAAAATLGAFAIVTAVVGVAAGAAATGAAGAAGAPPSGLAARLGGVFLWAAAWVAGLNGGSGGSIAAAAGALLSDVGLRALAWSVAAAAAWWVGESFLAGWEQRLLVGSYPPPRNLDRS